MYFCKGMICICFVWMRDQALLLSVVFEQSLVVGYNRCSGEDIFFKFIKNKLFKYKVLLLLIFMLFLFFALAQKSIIKQKK